MKQIKADYLDHMGNDISVVNAARVSYDKVSQFVETMFEDPNEAEDYIDDTLGASLDIDYICSDRWFGGWPVHHLSEGDTKLINFLGKHKHEIPFAHTQVSLRVRAPIPIRTQCFKHKIGFVENEVSRRYVSYTPELFEPIEWRVKPVSSKQGSGEIHGNSSTWKQAYVDTCDKSIKLYEDMIEAGICPEQARFVLPQGVLTEWVWTGSLLAFARFFNLRTDSHAQLEIQELARDIGKIIEPLYPVSWKALTGGGQ